MPWGFLRPCFFLCFIFPRFFCSEAKKNTVLFQGFSVGFWQQRPSLRKGFLESWKTGRNVMTGQWWWSNHTHGVAWWNQCIWGALWDWTSQEVHFRERWLQKILWNMAFILWGFSLVYLTKDCMLPHPENFHIRYQTWPSLKGNTWPFSISAHWVSSRPFFSQLDPIPWGDFHTKKLYNLLN